MLVLHHSDLGLRRVVPKLLVLLLLLHDTLFKGAVLNGQVLVLRLGVAACLGFDVVNRLAVLAVGFCIVVGVGFVVAFLDVGLDGSLLYVTGSLRVGFIRHLV